MTPPMVAGLVLLAAIALAPAVLTGLGAHRRGSRLPFAIGSGLIFPVTWVLWYVRDEHPFARRTQR